MGRHRRTQNEARAIGDKIQHKVCLRKRAFETEAEAKACQADQKVYRCFYCGKFHLSGQANTRRNIRKNRKAK